MVIFALLKILESLLEKNISLLFKKKIKIRWKTFEFLKITNLRKGKSEPKRKAKQIRKSYSLFLINNLK